MRPSEETYWTFGQAFNFALYRDVGRAHEAPPLFQFDGSHEAFEAFWALCRALEAGTVRDIEHRSTVDPLQWGDRQRHLRQHERLVESIGLGQFIAEVRKATCHTLIPVADVLAAFPAQPPAETASAPEPVASKPRAARKRTKVAPVERPLTPVQSAVMAALLFAYPGGRRTLHTYDRVLDRLAALPAGKKATVGRATLVRVLAKMPTEWREKR